jgi:hypothetical protein
VPAPRHNCRHDPAHSGKGDYEIYAIGNNSLLAAYFLGQVGLDWQPAGGLADVDSRPASTAAKPASAASTTATPAT